MHERFADWLEAAVGERAAEHSEILGHHLELAHHYFVESDRSTHADATWPATRPNGSRRPGWRSSSSGPVRRRCVETPCARADGCRRAGGARKVLAELGDALPWRGLFDEAAQVLAEAVESAGPAASRSRMLARLSQLRLAFQIDPAADYGAMEAEAIQAAEAFEAVGDDFSAAASVARHLLDTVGMCRLELMRPAAERGSSTIGEAGIHITRRTT